MDFPEEGEAEGLLCLSRWWGSRAVTLLLHGWQSEGAGCELVCDGAHPLGRTGWDELLDLQRDAGGFLLPIHHLQLLAAPAVLPALGDHLCPRCPLPSQSPRAQRLPKAPFKMNVGKPDPSLALG